MRTYLCSWDFTKKIYSCHLVWTIILICTPCMNLISMSVCVGVKRPVVNFLIRCLAREWISPLWFCKQRRGCFKGARCQGNVICELRCRKRVVWVGVRNRRLWVLLRWWRFGVQCSGWLCFFGGPVGISFCWRCSGPLPLMIALRVVLLCRRPRVTLSESGHYWSTLSKTYSFISLL